MSRTTQNSWYTQPARRAWPLLFKWTFRLAPYTIPLSLIFGSKTIFIIVAEMCPVFLALNCYMHQNTWLNNPPWVVEFPVILEFEE